MNIVDELSKNKGPAVVITDHDDRMNTLKLLRAARIMRPIRFMTEKDLFDKVFFAYRDHALFETSKALDASPAVAERFLDSLYFVDTESQYDSQRLKTLQDLKTTLMQKDALAYEHDLDSWFKDQEIILMKPVHDPFIKEALNRLEAQYPVKRAFDTAGVKTFPHTSLRTLEDEVTEIAFRMAQLHEKGTPYENMAVLNAHKAYEPHFRSILPMMGIPYNLDRRASLRTFPLTQTFLSILADHGNESPYEGFKNALDTLMKKARTDKEKKLVGEITQAVNPLVRLFGTVESLWPHIIHALNKNNLRSERYANGVDIKDSPEGGFDNYDQVFVVGMHEGFAPVFKEADDYLSESEKRRIGHPSAKEINRARKDAFLDSLSRHAHVHVFQSMESMHETYQPTTLLDALHEIHTLKKTDPIPHERQPYSEKLDLIKAKTAYDDYVFNDTVVAGLKQLYPLFKDKITPHDPTFKTLQEDTIQTLLTDRFNVSTTQVDRYAECGFRFLLEDLLDVDPVDEPFNLDLGTFFHDVLENTVHLEKVDEESLDDILERTLEKSDKQYSEREIAFFKNAFPFIRRAHRVIRSQHKNSGYTHSESEKKVETHFDFKREVTFKGKIDKVMRRDGSFFLVDYKTGSETLDITLAPHGLRAQLLYYVLLYMDEAETSRPVGFFEQTVYPKTPKRVMNKTKEEQLEEALKLKGYVLGDLDELRFIDKRYADDSFIHGLKITKKGDFQKNVKRFDEEGIDALLRALRTKLESMLYSISEGHFPINPKQDQKRRPISCTHCPFFDICYKRPEDFHSLEVAKDFKEVFETLKGDD